VSGSGYKVWYWSCTEHRDNQSNVWTARFSDGDDDWNNKNNNRLSCRPCRVEGAEDPLSDLSIDKDHNGADRVRPHHRRSIQRLFRLPQGEAQLDKPVALRSRLGKQQIISFPQLLRATLLLFRMKVKKLNLLS
jgi:hypothetical protein